MTAARAVICLALVCGACESGELKTDHDAATSDGFVPLDGPVTLTDAELDASPADTSSPDVAADMTADLAVPDLDPDAAPPVDASPALDGPLPLPDAALVPPVMGPAGCNYELLERRPGLFHTVTDDTPRLEVLPLPEGASFFCMRVEFTMQTANNLQAVADRFEGCPIFSHIVGIEGTGPEAQNVGGVFFRFMRVGCEPRPGAIEIDVWSPDDEPRFVVRDGPWNPGERYRIVQTVRPFTSSVEVFLDGERDGPRVEVDIDGSTVEMVRNAKVGFGLRQIFGGAFFPYYGSSYHDLEVWADVAPPVP